MWRVDVLSVSDATTQVTLKNRVWEEQQRMHEISRVHTPIRWRADPIHSLLCA